MRLSFISSVPCVVWGSVKSDHSKHPASLLFRSSVSQVQTKDSFVSVSHPVESTMLRASVGLHG